MTSITKIKSSPRRRLGIDPRVFLIEWWLTLFGTVPQRIIYVLLYFLYVIILYMYNKYNISSSGGWPSSARCHKELYMYYYIFYMLSYYTCIISIIFHRLVADPLRHGALDTGGRTETQKRGNTDGQKHRNTETQTDRNTESRKHRRTETQNYRNTQFTINKQSQQEQLLKH